MVFEFCLIDIPQAEGALRLLQKADSVALSIFHQICKKHNLKYWLDFGTALGAIRHKGFIPWDDDIDIAMPRKDYDFVKEYLKEELTKIGFVIDNGVGQFYQIIRLKYKNSAIQIDIWPFDYLNKESITQKEKNKLIKNIYFCRKHFKRKYQQKLEKGLISFPKDEFKKYQDKKLGNNLSKEVSRPILHSGSEALPYNKVRIYQYDDIFPLQEICFENELLWVPNSLSKYLAEIYGDYMKFPNEIASHIDISLKLTKVDVGQALNELSEIKKSKGV